MPLPSWTFSGILALLLGLFFVNQITGEEHGASQPQDPKTKKFISEDNNFWRWLISGLAVAAITAHLAPRVTPTVNSTLQDLSLMPKVAIGLWALVFLKGAFKKFG